MDLVVLMPESKAKFAVLLDPDLLYIALRHLQTVCEACKIPELSITSGDELLIATFRPVFRAQENSEPLVTLSVSS